MLRSVKILHLALLGSTLMYGLILLVVQQQAHGAPKPPPFDPMIFLVAAGVFALGDLFVVIPMIHKKILPPRARDGSTSIALDDPQYVHVLDGLMTKLRPGLIVTWALCEAVAMFGLVGGFLFHDIRYYLPFEALALIGFAIYAPTTAFFASFVRAATK